MQSHSSCPELDAAWMVRDLSQSPQCTWMLVVASLKTMEASPAVCSELTFLEEVRAQQHLAEMIKARTFSAWSEMAACYAVRHTYFSLMKRKVTNDDLSWRSKPELEEAVFKAVAHAHCSHFTGQYLSGFLWRYSEELCKTCDLLQRWKKEVYARTRQEGREAVLKERKSREKSE